MLSNNNKLLLRCFKEFNILSNVRQAIIKRNKEWEPLRGTDCFESSLEYKLRNYWNESPMGICLWEATNISIPFWQSFNRDFCQAHADPRYLFKYARSATKTTSCLSTIEANCNQNEWG